ncbi:xanthosine utilization system XapX-like protein [Actinoalloteichus hoggarensis]|uniref:DUF3159 domain-containing protein n=1 Tax=Actinoalloteichus hoggarensis TaxID=1470176 RepID=UPI001820BC33|nr:DUF3159 domain-containing protein [Actinoalloteichus hoggarensis]MBB5921381.1 xanthosine utilization system XapX-like protein [Actinoalloteichus hoggarensis]
MTEQLEERGRAERVPAADADSLPRLLGGRRGAADASVPPLVFVLGWWLGDGSVPIGAGAALLAGLVVALLRLRRGHRPVAALLGMLGVAVAAAVALYTGRAVDYFLVQLLSNAGSALVWALSILVRRPLLGVIVGVLLGQRMRWRRDTDLLRAYGRSSWVWVGQYLTRLAVFLPLWLAEQAGALVIARAALSLPLVTLCLAVSWAVLRKSLPPGHPGLRHPRTDEQPGERTADTPAEATARSGMNTDGVNTDGVNTDEMNTAGSDRAVSSEAVSSGAGPDESASAEAGARDRRETGDAAGPSLGQTRGGSAPDSSQSGTSQGEASSGGMAAPEPSSGGAP